MDKQTVENTLIEHQIDDFKWIKADSIQVANWVRMKCTYGCRDFGKAVCPPNTPSVEQCKDFISEYSNALIIRFKMQADKNSTTHPEAQNITKTMLSIERAIFLAGHHKTFMFNFDCCTLCKECVSSKELCKVPKNSRPSPEAFAIDVFGTVRQAGFPIEVVTNETQEVNRYALILVE